MIPINKFEGLYSCTLNGRIWSHRKFKFLKPRINKDGYAHVSLCKNYKKQSTYIAKLIAEAFLGPRPLGLQINHKDGNKLNNCIDNLEYVTPKENIAHSWRFGLQKSRKGVKRIRCSLP